MIDDAAARLLGAALDKAHKVGQGKKVQLPAD
jgi:hypothetical protein